MWQSLYIVSYIENYKIFLISLLVRPCLCCRHWTIFPRFEMPELNNPEKMSSKIVSNLLYYQTNYFISFLTIFLLVFFFVPWKMLYIIILLALGDTTFKKLIFIRFLVFGAQHYMSLHHVHVKVWKKNHPTAVMTATFIIGTFFIYQVCQLVYWIGKVQQ